MPIWYLITVAVFTAGTLFALVPPRRVRPLRTIGWLASTVVNESPFIAFYWLLAATLLALAQDDIDTPTRILGHPPRSFSAFTNETAKVWSR